MMNLDVSKAVRYAFINFLFLFSSKEDQQQQQQLVIEEDKEDDVGEEEEVKGESATGGIPMPPRDGEPVDGLISCSPLSNVTSVTETDTGDRDDSGSDRYGLTNEIVFHCPFWHVKGVPSLSKRPSHRSSLATRMGVSRRLMGGRIMITQQVFVFDLQSRKIMILCLLDINI